MKLPKKHVISLSIIITVGAVGAGTVNYFITDFFLPYQSSLNELQKHIGDVRYYSVELNEKCADYFKNPQKYNKSQVRKEVRELAVQRSEAIKSVIDMGYLKDILGPDITDNIHTFTSWNVDQTISDTSEEKMCPEQLRNSDEIRDEEEAIRKSIPISPYPFFILTVKNWFKPSTQDNKKPTP